MSVSIGFPFAMPAGLRNLEHLQPVTAPLVRKEQNIVVRARDEHVFDEVVFFRCGARDALAAAGLAPVAGHREPLDETRVADGNDDVFLGDHVFDAELFGLVDDFRPPLIAVFLLELKQLILDDLHLQLLALQNCLQPFDELDGFAVFVLNLLPLQAREPLQPHVENRLRLDLRQLEFLHQASLRRLNILRLLDQLDDRVDVVERDDVAFEDMRAFFRFVQLDISNAGR